MAQRFGDDRPAPRRQMRGFQPVVSLVERELCSPAEKRGFAETKLLTHWAVIVGPDVAAQARPVKIRFGRGFGGTLQILTTGANAPVLAMQKDQIIARVNACYGYSAIKDVQITQTAPTGFAEARAGSETKAAPNAAKVDPEKLARATKPLDLINDPILRDALHRLAGNILSKTTVSNR